VKYFDLHCDTLYECKKQGVSLAENHLNIDFRRLESFEKMTQVFAIWLDDTVHLEEAEKKFYQLYEIYDCDLIKNSKVNTILSVENGVALGGRISNVEAYYNSGVRIMTLAWNGQNELCSGANEQGGLTLFGKEVIAEMERVGMVIDVSHLNDQGFSELIKLAKRPFIATHSNSREICNHRRNLTDDQFIAIRKSGGIVGINLYPLFLNHTDKADYDDIYKHIAHFLSLGGENTLAIGTDFDGAQMAKLWNGVETMKKLYNNLLKREFGKEIVDKIFYENANNFFKGFDKSGSLI
jgi:membrane dipeptidase